MRTETKYTMVRVALSTVGALILSACGDEGQDTAPTPAKQAQTQKETAAQAAERAAAAEAAEAVEQTRDALLQEAVIKLGTVLDDYAVARETPDINEQVRNVLEKMNAYHEALILVGHNSPMRLMLALRIADCTLNFGAVAKAAEAYEQAQQSLDALPEDYRAGTEGSRAASSILRGRALCLLRQNKSAEAMPLYEQALENDKKMLEAFAPKEEKAPYGEEASQALADVLDSFRCLGDCRYIAGDPEEARTTYRAGMSALEATQGHELQPVAVLAAAKLAAALGDAEAEMGDTEKAKGLWLAAAQFNNNLVRSSAPAILRRRAAFCNMRLRPALEKVLKPGEGDTAAPAEQQEAPAEAPNSAS